jgi:hypothetical protein
MQALPTFGQRLHPRFGRYSRNEVAAHPRVSLIGICPYRSFE